jgi:YcaO-like protein with predicted kinase domain
MKPDPHQLEQAVEIYRRHLAGTELSIFDISSLDRIGIPIHVAALRTDDGFTNDGFGYGGSSAEALVGALGEMSETYHTHQALKRAPACEAVSYREMVERFGADRVLDPLTLCLPAGYPYHDQLPLRWVAVTRWSDGVQCWAPRETIAPGGDSFATQSEQVEFRTDRTPAKLFPPITCGLGAGLTIEQALAHGVLELLQRDGNCTTFRAMDRGIDIELDLLESDEIKATISHLADLGLRVRPKLASTEFGLVNLYLIAEPIAGSATAESFPLLATACGEAVHPNRERALRKALQEYLASRSRKLFMHGPLDDIRKFAPASYVQDILEISQPHGEEPKALREMAGWLTQTQADLCDLLRDTVFSSHKTVKFSALPSIADEEVASPVARMEDIAKRLGTAKIAIYYFDASPVGPDAPRVIKAVAPGLEGETLSYWRLGARGAQRLLERGSPLVSQGPPQPQDLLVPLTSTAQEALGGPVYFRVSEWEKILNRHYPLYREPSSHTAQKYLASHGA